MSTLSAIVTIGLAVLGYWTRARPRLWVVAGGVAVGVAYITSQDGRYDDSGGEVGYSILVAVIALVPVLVGRVVAAILSREDASRASPNS